MTGLWLLCLVGVGVAVGSVLPSDRVNSPCEPGDVWVADDGCNTCFCLQSGVAGCSRMDCSNKNPGDTRGASGDLGDELKPLPLPKPEEKDERYYTDRNAQKPKPLPLPLPEPQAEESKSYYTDSDAEKPEPKPVEERSGVSCASGEEWQEDCNSCLCLGDGKAACTMMGCSSKDRTMAEAMKDHCEAGTTWSDDCNVCHCVSDSQVICSYRMCAGAESRRRRRQTTCTPGEHYRVDCNECFCLTNGREACTKKFCLPASSSQTSQFSGSAKAAGGSSECKRECPADCGSLRGEDGCLTCQCDNGPFFGVLPEPTTDAAAAAGASGYTPNTDPVDPGFAVNPGWMLGGR